MNIGEAAQISGVSAKMVRYYESIGLIDQPHRSDSNYRIYDDEHVHTLRFIKRARSLGFSMPETGKLLALWQNKARASGDVKRVASNHIDELEQKIANMQGMVSTLRHLVHCCSGDDRPTCPILEELAAP